MGISTGVDFAKLLEAADMTQAVAPQQAGGRVRTVTRKRALAGFGENTRGMAA